MTAVTNSTDAGSDATALVRNKVASARKIVVKIGTNVVMHDDGHMAIARLYTIAESIAGLRRERREVLLVSSGAIGLGMQRLGFAERPQPLPLKQACAAVGQGRLMGLYADAFDRLGMVSAQVLLTEDDFTVAERYQNLRATLDTLLAIGAVPIVNENDTVSTLELERTASATRAPIFGDNDKLSALIATKIDADLLILLSDVDGLFTDNPSQVANAQLIPLVHRVTPELADVTRGGGTRGRGGMASKLAAAALAAAAGTHVVIANGRVTHIIDDVCRGANVGTLFLPEGAS